MHMKNASKQYTIRQVSADVDRALRRTARRLGKSLNQVALEALSRGAGLEAAARHSDLDAFFGSWVADRAVDEALEDQRRVDKGLWS